MSEPVRAFFKNKDDDVEIGFLQDGTIGINIGEGGMLLMPHVVLEKRGKIAHDINEASGIFHMDKAIEHPILFNRWFIQRLEEQPQWKPYVLKWREYEVAKKQERLSWDKHRRESPEWSWNDEAGIRSAIRLDNLLKALPEERAKAREEFQPILDQLTEIHNVLKKADRKYFHTESSGFTDLGMAGRGFKMWAIIIPYLDMVTQNLSWVVKSLSEVENTKNFWRRYKEEWEKWEKKYGGKK